jgi:hypothetical protein
MITTTLITAVRAGLLALLLGLAAALTAPIARGATPEDRGPRTGDRKAVLVCPLSSVLCPLAAVAPLAEDWSWREFWKYWRRHTVGRTSGIVGIVLLVAAGAVLLIISKSR